MSSIDAAMLAFKPLMTEDMPITVVTPITTPSNVSNERRRFLRSESKASRRISLMSQCRDGIQVRSSPCGIDSEEKTHGRRYNHRQYDRPPLHAGGHGREVGDGDGNGNADDDADHASH